MDGVETPDGVSSPSSSVTDTVTDKHPPTVTVDRLQKVGFILSLALALSATSTIDIAWRVPGLSLISPAY